MADQTNPANPQSQGAGEAGDKTKLYAGKYKTPEELEAGYKELERGFHDTRQEVSQLRQTIETRIPEPPADRGYGQGGTYTPVASAADPNLSAQVLSNFYQDPVGTLRSVAEVATQEAEKRILKRQSEEANNKSRVASWLAKNPDLEKHGDLLDFHVRQTDGRLAVESRLDEAAKRVRERLVELRGVAPESTPNPGSYIPGPSGLREGAPASQPVVQPATDGESQLASYAAQRNSGRMKIPGRTGRT